MENQDSNPTNQAQANPPLKQDAPFTPKPLQAEDKPVLLTKTAPVAPGFTENGNAMMLQAHHGFLVRRAGWVDKHVTGDGKGNLVVKDRTDEYLPWTPTPADKAATDWSVQK